MMFLDAVVVGNLLQGETAKRHWSTSEDVAVEFFANIRQVLELGGAKPDGFLEKLFSREKSYREALTKPLNLARFAVGSAFASNCGLPNDQTAETVGMGEFVSAVNYVGELLTRFRLTSASNGPGRRRFWWPFKQE